MDDRPPEEPAKEVLIKSGSKLALGVATAVIGAAIIGIFIGVVADHEQIWRTHDDVAELKTSVASAVASQQQTSKDVQSLALTVAKVATMQSATDNSVNRLANRLDAYLERDRREKG